MDKIAVVIWRCLLPLFKKLHVAIVNIGVNSRETHNENESVVIGKNPLFQIAYFCMKYCRVNGIKSALILRSMLKCKLSVGNAEEVA